MNEFQRYIMTDKVHLNDGQIHLLSKMGFFTAPAARNHHGAYEGGLFDHSYEMAKKLVELTATLHLNWMREESPWIVGMFHDLCKCDQYKIINHPADPVVSYGHNDHLLLTGHGEKSVMIASQIMTLTEEEILCIRYHMGAYQTDDWTGFDLSIRKYETVLWTHTADMYAAKVVGV